MIQSTDDSNISQRVFKQHARLAEAQEALRAVLERVIADPLDVRLVNELVSDSDHMMMVVQEYRSLLKDAAATIFSTLSEQDQ